MAISKNHEKGGETPPSSDTPATEKPRSSPARKIVLLLLLLATVVVVALDYLPEGDSKVVGPPVAKRKPQAQSPGQPQQQPAPSQPAPSPAPSPVPTPPQYEKPPEAVFVSTSPSDMAVSTVVAVEPPTGEVSSNAGATPASQIEAATPSQSPTVAETAPTAPESAAAEPPAEPMMAESALTPPPTENAATEAAPVSEPPPAPANVVTAPAVASDASPTAPQAAVAVSVSPTIPSPGPVAAAPAAPEPEDSAPSTEFVASRAPAPSTVPIEVDPSAVVVANVPPRLSQAAPRPLPEGSIPEKVNRYVERLLTRYDTNHDGVIDATECRLMEGDPSKIDYDADGEITLEELAAYTADFGRHRRMRLTGSMVEEAVAVLPPLYVPTAEWEAMAAAQAKTQQVSQQTQAVPVALVQDADAGQTEPSDVSESEEVVEEEQQEEDSKSEEGQEAAEPHPTPEQVDSRRFVTPKSRLAGLPEWFLARDTNGDGQLTVAEYAPGSEKARLAEFARYDRNKDGVLTPQECPKQ